MASEPLNALPLIVIVGPTASGKTSLAIKLAQQFNGEIISADSRAIYKGLSIGTAKPSPEEQSRVRHWGIDLVSPNERFTVADFQAYAIAKIEDIRSRGKIPFIVGGTGLYIDAVIFNFQFSESVIDNKKRDELANKSINELTEYCRQNNITLPINKKNKRHLISAILRNGTVSKEDKTILANTVVVGIATEKNILHERIANRAKTIFAGDVIAEAREASSVYGWDNEAMTGNIYPIIRGMIESGLSKQAAIDTFVIRDRQLAKRQLTWFRRNEHIHWLSLDEAHTYLTRLLDSPNNS